VPGILTIGEMGLAEALGWETKHLRRCFEAVSNAGLVVADWSSRIVFLPNACRHNPPASVNNVKGWADCLKELPETDLLPFIISRIDDVLGDIDNYNDPKSDYRNVFRHRLGKLFEAPSKHLRSTFEAPSKQPRTQDQDQDKEIYVEFAAEPDLPVVVSKKKSDVDAVVDAYKKHHPRARPGAKERRLITDRLRDNYDTQTLIAAIEGCHITPHNIGQNERGQKYLGLELIMRTSSQVQRFAETWGDRSVSKNDTRSAWADFARVHGVKITEERANEIAKIVDFDKVKFQEFLHEKVLNG